MIGYVSPDRWTCPTCLVTEIPNAGEGAAITRAITRAIRRVQELHAARHNAERTRAAKREAPKLSALAEAGAE